MTISSAVLRQAELRMWMVELDAFDAHKRRIAARKVLELTGTLEAVRALAADGELRPPPAWPLVDIVPLACRVQGGSRVLVTGVRTAVAGQVWTEEVPVAVPLADGALADAVERGRRALRGGTGRF